MTKWMTVRKPACICRLLMTVVFFLLTLFSSFIFALPQGGTVAAGQSQIATTPNHIQVNQTSQKAIINWQSYNLGAKESITYSQPSRHAISLNRINPKNGPSSIYGKINANGQVWLINGAGIWFAPGSVVNVAGMIASTADISNQDFLTGHYQFAQTPGFNGAIVNEGIIKASEAGLVALVGGSITNNGYIEATMGTVVLAAGSRFTVNFAGSQFVSFAVDEATLSTAQDQEGRPLAHGVKNMGTIVANGGKVMVAAKTASHILDNAINLAGVTEAKTVGVKNGEIILLGNAGKVTVSGKLNVSGRLAKQKGGTIKVMGNRIALEDGAVLDASGKQGGGTILIGGDYQGKSSMFANSKQTYVAPKAVLNANAITQGNGGKVIVWADDATVFLGMINARGGEISGDGGLVETSGKNYLAALGNVDAGGVGKPGMWLLDPWNISIQNALSLNGVFNGLVPNVFTAAGTPSIASQTTIQASLNLNTSVTIQANGNGGSEAGNISVDATLTKSIGTGSPTLTLIANQLGTITINQLISATTGSLNVVLSGATDASPNTLVGAKAITLNAGVTTRNGTFTATVANSANVNDAITGNGVINTGTGAITMTVPGSGTVGTSGTPLSTTSTTTSYTVTGGGGAFISNTGSFTLANATVNNGSSLSIVSSGQLTLPALALSTSGTGNLTLRSNGGTLTTQGALSTGTGTLTLVGSTGLTINHVLTTSGGAVVLGPVTGGAVTINNTIITNGGNFTSTSSTGTTLGNAGGTTPGVVNATNGSSGGSISFTVNTAAGASSFLMNANSSLSTTANAVNISVNTGSAGTGTATLRSITASGSGSSITVRTDGPSGGNTTGGDIVWGAGVAESLDIGTTTGTISLLTPVITNDNIGTSASPVRVTQGTLILTSGSSGIFINHLGNGALALNGVNTSGAFTLNSTGSNGITSPGSITVTGTTTIAAGSSNNVTLTNASNDFSTLLLSSGNVVSIADVNALTLGASTVNGNLDVSVGTSLTASSTLSLGGAAATFASTGGGAITFSGAVNGQSAGVTDLTVNTSGTTTFSSTVGTTTALKGITTDAGGSTAINGATMTVSGSTGMIFNDAVTLGATTTLNAGSASILFNSTLNSSGSARALTLNSTDITRFVGAVGSTLALSSLTTNAGGSTEINGGAITSSAVGGQVFNDNVVINADTTLTSSTGVITFNGTLNSSTTARDLTLTGSGTTTFASTVGNTNAFKSLTTNGGGTTAINGGSVQTSGTGGQTYTDAVTLAADTTLSASAAPIIFSSTVNSSNTTARRLILSTSGLTTFNGTVGVTNALLSLNVNNGPTAINTGTVTTNSNGGQSYVGAVTLGASTTLSASSGDIQFSSTIDSGGTARSLTLNTTGTTSFNGIVGGTSALGILTTNTGGTTALNSTAIYASGMTFNDAVTVGDNVMLDAGVSAVTFASTINSPTTKSLTVRTSNTKTFSGAIGTTNALNSFILEGNGTSTTISGGAVTTTSIQSYDEPTTFTVNTILTGNNITFDSTLNSSTTARTLTINDSGTTTFNNTVGATNAFSTITTDAVGETAINGGSIRTTGSQTYNDQILMTGPTSFITTSGNFSLANTANSFTPTATFSGTITNLTYVNTSASAAMPVIPASFASGGNVNLQLTNTSMLLPAISIAGATSALTVIANGVVTQSGALAITGTTTVSAGNLHDITLTTSTNNFGTLNIGSGHDVSIVDSNGIILSGAAITGSLTLTAGGAITQTGALNSTGLASILTATTKINAGAAITLNTFSNDFAAIDMQTLNLTGAAAVAGAIGYRDQNSMQIDRINTTSGAVSMTADNGAITESGSGVISSTGTSTFSASGVNNNIVLDNAVNDFGTVAITSGNDVTLRDATSIVLGTSTINGAFNVTVGTPGTNAITQTGVLIVTGLPTFTVTAANSDILLATSANVFSTTPVFVQGGIGTIRDLSLRNTATSAVFPSTIPATGLRNLTLQFNNTTTALELPALTLTGTLSVTTGAATITQSAPLSVSGTATFNAGATNDITLTNTNNNFSTVAITNGNDVRIKNTGSLNIAASTVQGDFYLTTQNALTDSGAIIMNSGKILYVNSVNGAVLNTATNQVYGLHLTNTTSGAVQLTTLQPLTLYDITQNATGALTFIVNNPLTIAAGSNVSAGNTIAITATDIDFQGYLASVGQTTITQASLAGLTGIGVGDAAGSMTITKSDLQHMSVNGLSIVTGTQGGTDGFIHVDNVSVANDLTNINGTITLTATAGAAGEIEFQNNGSSFKTLTMSTDNININADVETQIGALTATVTAAGGGEFAVSNNATVASNDANITITTPAIDLTNGNLNSGSGTITLTNSAGTLYVGNPAGTFHLDNTELSHITTNNLTLTNANNSQILVEGAVTGSNITTLTLNAATGTLGSILFQTAASTFNVLTAQADNGVTVDINAPITTTGNLTLNGDLGGGVGGNDKVSLNANLTANNGNITLSATNGGIELVGDATLHGANVMLSNAVNGAFNLIVNADNGVATFSSTVGATTPLASLTANATTSIAINGGSVITTGTQFYQASVTLGANAALTTTNSAITFDSTISNATARILAIDVGSGVLTFGGAVGTLSALDLTSSTRIAINGGSMTTSGVNGQIYNGPVYLGADTTFSAGNTRPITFNSTIDSDSVATLRALTLNTSSGVTFNDVLGSIFTLGAITANIPAAVTINGGSIASTGSQTYGSLITLGGNTTFSVTGANLYDIALTNNANNFSQQITFAGQARDISLTNASANASMPVFTNTARNVTLNFSNAGMTFSNLQLTGTLTAIANGVITQANNSAISAAALITQSQTGTVLLGQNTIGSLQATNNGNGNIRINNTSNSFTVQGITQQGAGNIEINNIGDMIINGNITATTGQVLFNANQTDTLQLGADITTQGGSITLGPTTLIGAPILTTQGGNITLTTVTGPSNFTLNAGSGNATFQQMNLAQRATIYANNAIGALQIANLTIDLLAGHLTGLVHGGMGDSAILTFTVLNPLVPNKIFFNGIDIYYAFNPLPPPPPPPVPGSFIAPPNIVLMTNYTSANQAFDDLTPPPSLSILNTVDNVLKIKKINTKACYSPIPNVLVCMQ